ncbi:MULTISPECIES: ParB/RepB/Spo0J family partition protein [Bradyrhizobium]|uniref:ParB family chromosome partitioning protein n=1 Tax=Bradyrhizobium elkanii TaxID=29448 RepID=A0A8I1Y164_BRAEL|nr:MULTISPECIES: ParB/RepB/Spo0J family partition protein [Bradyrhizobium]MBP1291167.1 ParB family chromosome partitioning protein [Bradyrhizobium elkanii]MCP1928516.1 ParB family chromosome partitioning protein [Bradyrhizobium elkanii]MCS3580869.1 ParB family chromosome partitioning protein [Bradyrhizobium elkanii]MCS3723745.1 ParB family chromosome partitioning protein [Bradyrhizobium elkanii]MCS4008155.1 ParB family chromosome partitioning protein [Bradyrhizobium elkanii USDA 61]
MSAKSIGIPDGTEVLIPLGKLKKSPKNARKTPHSDAAIEALAASIAAKGMLQNLVVEPEVDGEGAATGIFCVTIGEGRRLAQLLRVKRKEIRKSEPIRCIVDTANDPHEISLDENVTRENMHPADQFEAFRKQAEERGLGAEEIAARFGVSAHVVRQRLRLGAVSPKLMQVYRDGGLVLEQLMAFAITDDHARQEAVHERLPFDPDACTIRRLLTETHVAATDRRARFVGLEAYAEAGGTILRDLFTEDRGGYLEDVALLDLLVTARLGREADSLRAAEGWRWTEAHLDFPHARGLRRVYPHPVELSAEDQAALQAVQTEFDRLTEQHQTAEELPDDVDARFGELEADIERLEAKRQVYDPDDVARGGAFVVLNHDGTVRVERGFIRPEDEKPEAATGLEGDAEAGDEGDREGEEAAPDGEDDEGASDEEDGDQKLSDALVRDLTAHRTLGLRLNLSEQPDVAIVAITHALAAQIFYVGAAAHVAGIQPVKTDLAAHADGIEDTPAGKAWSDRHANWARQMPKDVAELWEFVAELDHDSRMALFAHCVSLTVNAVKLPFDRRPRALAAARRLAEAVALDMTSYWRPTVRSYLGRVTKANIRAAVREGLSEEAAERMSAMKKADMAQAAEQLLAATDWLPSLLRTAASQGQAGLQSEAQDREPHSQAAE